VRAAMRRGASGAGPSYQIGVVSPARSRLSVPTIGSVSRRALTLCPPRSYCGTRLSKNDREPDPAHGHLSRDGWGESSRCELLAALSGSGLPRRALRRAPRRALPRGASRVALVGECFIPVA